MTIPNPEHLLQQAEKLLVSPQVGAPRQADLRRAISTAYYALFHALLAAIADEFLGSGQRNTARYGLVYRSIDHRTLKDGCIEVAKVKPTAKYLAYLPVAGMGREIRVLATTLRELQGKRHSADYDPTVRFKTVDATDAITSARAALRSFNDASSDNRKLFLTLLLCPPR